MKCKANLVSLAITAVLTVTLLAFASPANAHADPWTPTELGAVIAAEVAAFQAEHPPVDGPEIAGFGPAPEYATNCRYTIRSTRTSAVGICYNYSGSGSLKYQVAALMYDGCRSRYWAYGSVGWVYYPGKTTTGKWSYVYSPPGKWYITYAQVIAWKP